MEKKELSKMKKVKLNVINKNDMKNLLGGKLIGIDTPCGCGCAGWTEINAIYNGNNVHG